MNNTDLRTNFGWTLVGSPAIRKIMLLNYLPAETAGTKIPVSHHKMK